MYTATNSWDDQYLNLCRRILDHGYNVLNDRTGTGTRQVNSATITVDLREGFPLLTTKKLHFRSILGELLWFISGNTNAEELAARYGVTIWDEWADSDGELGPIYGHQWRHWEVSDLGKGIKAYVDQLENVINDIRSNPFSRRHIVSAWNVSDLPKMKLPPCHNFFQFIVEPDVNGKPRYLNLEFDMRSVDVFLGLPYNMASYALLLKMVAHLTGLVPKDLTFSGKCVHIYQNHFEYVHEQLTRKPLTTPEVTLSFDDTLRTIDDFTPQHFDIIYHAHPNWKNVPVAV